MEAKIQTLENTTFAVRGLTNDPDTIDKPGIYYLFGGTIHAPEPGNGYTILHFATGGRTAQVALVNGVTNNYYIRTRTAGQTKYSVWRKITTTEV